MFLPTRKISLVMLVEVPSTCVSAGSVSTLSPCVSVMRMKGCAPVSSPATHLRALGWKRAPRLDLRMMPAAKGCRAKASVMAISCASTM